LLKIGFEEDLTLILELLGKDHQTMIFSATQTKKVEDLIRLSMNTPLYIGVDDKSESATVCNLE